MKTFFVTIQMVSPQRAEYYNLLIDGKPMMEIKYVHGHQSGYPNTQLAEDVMKHASRIINTLHFEDKGILGGTGDFQIELSNPLISDAAHTFKYASEEPCTSQEKLSYTPTHSQGLWTLEYDGSLVIEGHILTNGPTLAPEHASKAQRLANMQLIATSPRLLKACEKMIQAIANSKEVNPILKDAYMEMKETVGIAKTFTELEIFYGLVISKNHNNQ